MKRHHTITRVVLLLLVAAAGLAVGGGWQTTPAHAGSVAQQRDPFAQDAAGEHLVAERANVFTASSSAPGQDATLTIRTAPPLPGIRLRLGDTTVTTDESGIAAVTEQRGTSTRALTLLDTSVETPGKRYVFSRWIGQRDPDQAYTPIVDASMRADSTLTATFSVQYAVTAQFVDQDGIAIDPAQVTSATVRSDTGALIPMAATGPTWLEGTRVTARANKYDLEDVSYSWQSVTVSGTNVVDAGRQSFAPARTAAVTVAGQFHDLTVVGYDALLGHGAGAQAVITLPDGTVRSQPLDHDDSAVFLHLPRGTYQATVTAGASIVADHQVRLSRDVTLRAPVISPIDIAIVGGSVVLFALGLVIVGRRQLRRRLVAPFRPAATADVEAR